VQGKGCAFVLSYGFGGDLFLIAKANARATAIMAITAAGGVISGITGRVVDEGEGEGGSGRKMTAVVTA